MEYADDVPRPIEGGQTNRRCWPPPSLRKSGRRLSPTEFAVTAKLAFGRLSSATFVMIVASTDFRNLNDLSQLRRLNQSWVGCVLFQRQVSPEIAIAEER